MKFKLILFLVFAIEFLEYFGFLMTVFFLLLKDYDIVIWSATSMKWVEEKMKLLGVSTHPMYKISFYLDYLAMISVHSQKYGVIEVRIFWMIYNVLFRGTCEQIWNAYVSLLCFLEGETVGCDLGQVSGVFTQEHNHDR